MIGYFEIVQFDLLVEIIELLKFENINKFIKITTNKRHPIGTVDRS